MNSSIKKINFHPCIISLDKLNIKQIKLKRTNSKQKGIELNLQKKTIFHQRSKSKECLSTNKQLIHELCKIDKGKKLIINKAELFHNIKKKSTLLNNNIRPLQSKGLSRSNSISNIEQISSSDASTATSKRIPKKNNYSKNHTNYIQHYIPKIKNETKIVIRNIDNINKRKNTQIRYNNNSLSLLSEDSVFNISKHRTSSNNDSSSNKQNSIKHSTSNSKEKSKSDVDLTYSDDEVLSNRKKCDKMIKKTLVRNRTIIKNNTNDFISFYKEMNMKLFGIYK